MPSEREQARAIGREMDRAIERVVRVLAVNVTAELTRANPVDTGWSKSNWIPSVGASVEEAPGSPENIGPSSAAQDLGRSRVLTYRLRHGMAFITNNVPYITALNAGRSVAGVGGMGSAFDRLLAVSSLRSLRF